MNRTIIAFETQASREALVSLLEKNGIAAGATCPTAMEVIRTVKKWGGGVVICGYKLADMTADALCSELHSLAYFLVIGKPGQLAMCENQELFRLPAPLRGGELAGSVHMLLQLDERRSRKAAPQRSAGDQELIRLAKELVMARNDMTEDAAHRFLQRRSMDSGLPMTQLAALMLNALEPT